jgi:predicted TIM-barrel fold metal-dependent hydrolase
MRLAALCAGTSAQCVKASPEGRVCLPSSDSTPQHTCAAVLLALAKHPNIAVKASAVTDYSSEAYPFPILHSYLRQVFDAFGPKRIFWGSDTSRVRHPYRQMITLFTEELAWLGDEDKAWIMGRGLCEWLKWPVSAA